MDNSYKIIEQMILQEMDYRGSRQQPKKQKSKEEIEELRVRVKNFEVYMKRIFDFDLTQRVGKEDGMASQRQFGELLLSGLGPLGASYEEKLKNLQAILNSRTTEVNVSGLFSALTIAKMMNTLLYDMNQRKAGNAFEVFMAVLMGGSIEETYGPSDTGDRKEDFDIIDLTAPAGNGVERYSLKFVKSSAFAFKGSPFNMMNEVIKNGYVNYIFCMKNETDDRKKVSLTFKKFTISKEKFREVNIDYLKNYRFLDSFDKGNVVEDSKDMYFGAKKSVNTSLSLFDIQTVATLEIGLDSLRDLLNSSKEGYITLLMNALGNLNDTSENLARFIYTDDVESGARAKQGAEKLATNVESALTKRKEKGVSDAK